MPRFSTFAPVTNVEPCTHLTALAKQKLVEPHHREMGKLPERRLLKIAQGT